MFVIISKGNKKKIISFALLISIVMAVFSNTAITTAVKAETLDETTEEVTLSEVDVPELLSYNDAVANGHTARQYYSEPDLYTAVFANRDGSYTYYNFSEPIKYVGSDGNIYDKRSELTYTRGKYITEQNDVAVEISPDAASGAVLAVGNSSITIVPQFVADNTVHHV